MSLKITESFQANYAGVFNVLDNINFVQHYVTVETQTKYNDGREENSFKK